MNDYEVQRQANITRNKALIESLGLPSRQTTPKPRKNPIHAAASSKVQKPARQATRISARIASAPARQYNEDEIARDVEVRSRRKSTKPIASRVKIDQGDDEVPSTTRREPAANIDELRAKWTSWTPTQPEPTRTEAGVLVFADSAAFTPNKTPEEIIREGAFGGSYFRPYFSSQLRATIDDDWEEVPEAWRDGLDVDRFLRSPDYDPEVNKFKVACGQSLEQWEAAGWMNHEFDVRGWFQWYMRFYLGRRCDDDERQIGRWARCVGERGRFRRTLLKQYLARGIRNVFDDGEEQDFDVSPVVSQTCHHWGYEVKQQDLDDLWANGIG